MAVAEDQNELIEQFQEFYRTYYREAVGELAQQYPNERKSLYVDWNDLFQFNADLADDYLEQPEQVQEYAEEALRLYDLPIDVKLGQAHVRIRNLPEITDIREIRSRHVNTLVSVQGIVRKATSVRPKIEEAAFECQRCGTLTRIPQTGNDFQEPHECQGCERQGPFQVNFDQSEFVDSQKLRVQESPEGLRGGETPEAIDINVEDDITGEVTPGDHVTVTGILRLQQQGSGQDKSAVFDIYMDGISVAIEDEQFEEMDITDEDKQAIVELSAEGDIYEQMVDSIAPSIYGYRQEKLAMILQLFSGVTKHLPDESRIRGDLHMLLIGDPGTGKCLKGDTKVTLADGSERRIRDIVEANLDDPIPIDDGVYQEVNFPIPSLDHDGDVTTRRATKVWKRETPEAMYRIRTSSGNELEVTPSHPLFVQSQGQFKPVTAENLTEGAFVATPRLLQTDCDDRIDVEYRESAANNAIQLDLPEKWSPSLARLVGYIIAEGHVEWRDDNTGSVRITNNDREVLDDIKGALADLGLNYTETKSREDKDAQVVRCCSGGFVSFLSELEPAILERSDGQRVPDAISRASDDVKAEFLKAYIEGEGHVAAAERELTIRSMSKKLLKNVQSLLRTLGIVSHLLPRNNGSYRLRISGTDFESYVESIGFVTARKSEAATAFSDVSTNTNTHVIPRLGDELRRIRTNLKLSQADCGAPRTTYQHYERGDRDPSRSSLRTVIESFEDRLAQLRKLRDRIETGGWADVEPIRKELDISQRQIANGTDITQTAVSYYERREVVPDGGHVNSAKEVILQEIEEALAAEKDVKALRALTDKAVAWERIDSIERIEPEYNWVYDLEVEGTHNYISNGVFSHNSAMLQYIRNIAPRSVYTSGKGSSSAGLCVTGDTMIHTEDGFKRIGAVAREVHPDPVSENASAERELGLYTYDASGAIERRDSSHVWRMPKKPCRRIETAHGKELEASVNTPVLVCGERGLQWKEISDVETGEYVAVPKYRDIERSTPPVSEYLEFTNETVRLSEDSIEFVRERLCETFGTLRDAAAELGLSEDFIYDSLSNRFVPLERLDTILDAIDADRGDVEIRRAMLRHGDDVRLPREFDEDLMYLVGLVFGDGDISLSRRGDNRGMVRISNSDEALLRRAADIIERTFDKRVEIERQEDKVPCIRLNSATISRFFANVGMQTPKEDLTLDERLTTAEHADAFVRGLMDADGSVSVRTDGGSSIQFSTISDDLARQLQLVLETYGVHAKTRERDRRGEYTLDSGQTITSRHVQTHLEIYGADIDAFASHIGFESTEKSAALDEITDTNRRERSIPLGDAVTPVRTDGGDYLNVRNDTFSRQQIRELIDDHELGDLEPMVEEIADADLRWDEVVAAEDTGRKEVYDLTVPDTHNFLANGIVTHNTAAAVRDDFGDGQQWTLEAGALVLADQGVAAVDELDKMRSEDRSAMHEALEQQSISISKAGINATLKSRCSLLGAANPKYGRFDQYEPIGEQIDLEPALISRFDLIFTVTDQPDPDEDQNLAEHILQTNFAGELNTQRTEMEAANVSQEQVDDVTEDVAPEIDAELLRKYVAYAKRSCYPTMTEEAKEAIRDFYVDLRSKGADEDAPVPVTARKLEALVRLSEASARVRLSDYVEEEDAERVIEIVRSCLQDIGVDPETGQFDADVVETGTSKSQRDRIKDILTLIAEIEEEYDEGAPIEVVLERAEEAGTDRSKVEHEIEQLKQKGEVYEPSMDTLRTT